MVELTSEEQSYLRRLLEIEENGGSVDEHIARRLYGELSEVAATDGHGNERLRYSPEYGRERAVYEALAEKGLIAPQPVPGARAEFGELTSEGRCWFRDRDEAARIERENVRGGRRHDYLVALFSVVSGAVAGFFGGTYGHGLIAIIRSWLGL